MLRELRKGGYTLVHERVESAQALAHALLVREWDLIISDYVMPGFSGLDALRMVRDSRREVPFIVVSGKMGEETAVEVMRGGAHDYILKGKLARLLPAIERELQETEARRQAKNALHVSEEKFRAIFDNAPFGIFQSTQEGKFLGLNPCAAAIFGYDSPEQMINAIGNIPQQMFVKPDQRDDLIRRAMESKKFVRNEVEYRRRDGSCFIGNLHMRVVCDGNGEIAFLEGFVEDITERKRAEEAFERQFRQISTIFDELNAVVFVADLGSSEMVYLNGYGSTLLQSQWQGKACYDVMHCDRPAICTYASPEGLLPQAGDQQTRRTHEYQNAATGRSYQCLENCIPWIDGRMVRIAVAVDITDLKEMARIKDEMISAVSHEMKTPLTAIRGYTEFLLGNDVGEERSREYLGIIRKETERLIDLIDNFLEMQLLKARQQLGKLVPLQLQPLIEESVALFAGISTIHQFAVEVSPGLPLILSDEPYVRRVLNNLLSNAVKFSPRGGRISVGASRSDDETVTLWVEDHGIGIPPEVLDKIFDKFYQVDSGDRRGYGGAGLGLALVREIVNANGGRVWAESTPGKGSTFFVSFPVAGGACGLG